MRREVEEQIEAKMAQKYSLEHLAPPEVSKDLDLSKPEQRGLRMSKHFEKVSRDVERKSQSSIYGNDSMQKWSFKGPLLEKKEVYKHYSVCVNLKQFIQR